MTPEGRMDPQPHPQLSDWLNRLPAREVARKIVGNSGGESLLDTIQFLIERASPVPTPSADAKRKAVANCYMMAKREIARIRNGKAQFDATGLERWEAVLRFCEESGEKSSILRDGLPTEITDGSPSADARAKLEQALDHWASARDRMYVAKDAMDEVFRAGQFPQSRKHERLKRNYNDAVMGEANAAIEVLRLHRLSALPPHEGETPKGERHAPACPAFYHEANPCSCGARKREGETPQRMECPTCHDDDCKVSDGECYNCRQRRAETPKEPR